MKDGQPLMILGSPGGDDQVMRTMQTLINVIDFGMNVQQAIEAPRWSTRALPGVAVPAHDVSGRPVGRDRGFRRRCRRRCIAKGHKLTHVGRLVARLERGDHRRREERGSCSAGADPRVDAYAWAR